MIAFRYKNSIDDEPVHNDPYVEGEHLDEDDNPTQLVYYCIDAKQPNLDVVVDTGVLLNGRSFSHTLYKKEKYKFIISADELMNTAYDNIGFFKRFWSALNKYISIQIDGAFSDYVEVETNGGAFPIEYIDGVEKLPEITLELTTVYGV